MKSRHISLFAFFTTLCTLGIQAGENPFAPKNISLAETNAASSPTMSVSPEQTSTMTSTPAETAPSPFATEAVESTNPFAPASTEDNSLNPKTDLSEANEHTTTAAPTNPFAPTTLESHPMTDAHPMGEPEDHEALKEMPSLPRGHLSNAEHAASIKTLAITPGHSTTLEPISITDGVEAERYFIQDKKYESYLSSMLHNGPHGTPTERTYHVTIPATVHVGSFTVFKVQGMHGIPDHFTPAYHVEIQGNMHEIGTGTQYPEPQGSAVEKLTQLEDTYLTGVQTQFKAFTLEVRELISTAHKNGESLEAAKQHQAQITSTKERLTLTVGESHLATSFTGGSAQSSNPAIVSAVLKFDGTKTAPHWKLVLTGNKAGEAIITYSTGSESYLQPITVIEKNASLSSVADHTTVEEEEPAETTPKKVHPAAPAHDEENTHEESNEQPALAESKSTEENSEEEKDEGEDSEETDEKTAHQFAKEDEPFATFLKQSPEDETEPTDEEPAEDQEENK